MHLSETRFRRWTCPECLVIIVIIIIIATQIVDEPVPHVVKDVLEMNVAPTPADAYEAAVSVSEYVSCDVPPSPGDAEHPAYHACMAALMTQGGCSAKDAHISRMRSAALFPKGADPRTVQNQVSTSETSAPFPTLTSGGRSDPTGVGPLTP